MQQCLKQCYLQLLVVEAIQIPNHKGTVTVTSMKYKRWNNPNSLLPSCNISPPIMPLWLAWESYWLSLGPQLWFLAWPCGILWPMGCEQTTCLPPSWSSFKWDSGFSLHSSLGHENRVTQVEADLQPAFPNEKMRGADPKPVKPPRAVAHPTALM